MRLIPMSFDGHRGRVDLNRASEVIEDWLDTQEMDGVELCEDAIDELRRVGELARCGAPRSELDAAARTAREAGWSWAPIALLLGETKEHARKRVNVVHNAAAGDGLM